MLRHNIKEYELLEKDIAEIKACITRYIAYIVSVFGLIVFIGKYLIIDSETSHAVTSHYVAFKRFTPILVLTALLVITFLFEIIWYKFKSHNRHVGYQQLMSQETNSYYLNSNIKSGSQNQYDHKDERFKKETNNSFNNEYYCYNSQNLEPFREPLDILSFKFIMSRYNDSGSIQDIKKVIKSTEKAWFCFEHPMTICNDDNVDSSSIDKINSLDKSFFKEIIYPQFDDSIDTWWSKIWLGLSNIVPLFRKVKANNCRTNIDPKYISISWLYPRKLLQLGVILFALLSFFFFYSLSQHFEFSKSHLFSLGSFFVTIYFLMVWRWVDKYLFQIQDLISGVGSTDYYCWAFFVYRVQFLNANNIIPKYYSRSFWRYYKSKYISQKVNLKESTNEIRHLEICKAFKEHKSLEKHIISKIYNSNPTINLKDDSDLEFKISTYISNGYKFSFQINNFLKGLHDNLLDSLHKGANLDIAHHFHNKSIQFLDLENNLVTQSKIRRILFFLKIRKMKNYKIEVTEKIREVNEDQD